MRKLEKEGVSRYFVKKNGEFPVKDEILPDFEGNWDFYKNNRLENRGKVLYFYKYNFSNKSCFFRNFLVDYPEFRDKKHLYHHPGPHDEKTWENTGFPWRSEKQGRGEAESDDRLAEI